MVLPEGFKHTNFFFAPDRGGVKIDMLERRLVCFTSDLLRCSI